MRWFAKRGTKDGPGVKLRPPAEPVRFRRVRRAATGNGTATPDSAAPMGEGQPPPAPQEPATKS